MNLQTFHITPFRCYLETIKQFLIPHFKHQPRPHYRKGERGGSASHDCGYWCQWESQNTDRASLGSNATRYCKPKVFALLQEVRSRRPSVKNTNHKGKGMHSLRVTTNSHQWSRESPRILAHS